MLKEEIKMIIKSFTHPDGHLIYQMTLWIIHSQLQIIMIR